LEHRKRAETRTADVKGLRLPTWEEIESREYHKWQNERTVIDTAKQTEKESFEMLIRAIGE
jgi:hypothetical protein